MKELQRGLQFKKSGTKDFQNGNPSTFRLKRRFYVPKIQNFPKILSVPRVNVPIYLRT